MAKQSIPRFISLPMVFFLLVVIVVVAFYFIRGGDARLGDAEQKYKSGEVATVVAERQKSFNEALQLYQLLEEEYHPYFGTGKLYYNIGNVFFQLEEYPWAILNYRRAQALMPRSEQVTINLGVAEKKLSLEGGAISNPFSIIFFFHTYFSLPERLQLFFFFSLLALICASGYVWLQSNWLKYTLWVFLILGGVNLLSLTYTRYFSPVQAVLVRSSDLYRDAGFQYARVGDQPLPAGIVVEVLNSQPDGKWLKILSPKGDPGFVSTEVIRVLE